MKALTGDGRAKTRLVLLLALIAALALGGAAAKISSAATNGVLTANATVLNDQNPLVLGAPSPGGNIGYDLSVINGSTNTVNHLVFTDTIGNKGTVVFINAPANVSCSGMGTSTLSCTSVQLASGAGFDVIVLFSTDPNAVGGVDQIINTGSGTYAPQSNNTSNNRTDGTKSFTFPTVPRTYAAGKDQSLALANDPLNTGGGFFVSSVRMPPGFLHSNNYVGVTLQNNPGVLPANASTVCPTCQPFQVQTTIPLASTVDSPNNPFLVMGVGGSTDPYTWSFTIPVPKGFKPTGVFHEDDNLANPQLLPTCQTVGGQPVPLTVAPGICVSSMTVSKGSQWTVTYSGIGVANGYGWGS
jgi:hypothetical protein